jgi:predicted Zn-dependent protease
MRDRVAVGAVLAIAAVAAGACATNPATGQRQFSLMSEAQEIQIGQQQDVQVRREMGVYEDRALQQYVSDVGVRLAQQSERPGLLWHFTIVDVPAVNAFALPGGYVYITRGILPFLDDEAQLACVLGHEIGHVTARHAAQQYSNSAGAELGILLGSIFVPEARPFGQLAETGVGTLLLKYSRDDELQADQLGVRYASHAGWEPDAMRRMLTTLGRIDDASDDKGVPNWLSTHPSPENRIERVQAAVQQAEIGAARVVNNRDEYLRRIDGVIYGDNPEQGIVRGNTFLHPGLRFTIEFPRGWDVKNSQTQVVAKEPGQNAFMVLQQMQRPVGRSLEDAAIASMQRAGFTPIDGGQTTVNGLAAFLGTYQGTVQDLGRVRVRAAHIVHDRHVYLIAGLAPMAISEPHEAAFSQSIRSFRPMARGEAEAISPNRIDLYTARPGDTWQTIADRQSQGLVKPATLAIMNGRAPTDQPRPGDRLKIVVGG